MLQTIILGLIASLALFPLLLFWAGLLGGRWSPWLVWLFLVAGVIVVAWRLCGRAGPWLKPDRPTVVTAVALLAIFVLALATRLYLIKGIPYPAGGDSYHHTIITQIILETGRVPESYHPYADLDTFVYHFGFHAYSAFLAWVTGLPAHRAVFWGGELLNALTVPSVFLFVDRLGKDRRGALVAAVVAGLVCLEPAYYVNWGRYTQLTGQLILPAGLVVMVEAGNGRKRSWRAPLLTGMLAGGLLLTHYRVCLFYGAGLLVLGLTIFARYWRNTSQLLWVATRLLVAGSVAVILVAPWLPSLLERTIDMSGRLQLFNDGPQYDYITLDFVLAYGLRLGSLIASVAAAVYSLATVRRRPLGALILLWFGLVVFLANPVASGMPSVFLSNGTVMIAMYLPASVIIGLASGDLLARLERSMTRRRRVALPQVRNLADLLLGAALLVLSLSGAGEKLFRALDMWDVLVTNADLRAGKWIEERTSPDAVFMVGAYFLWPRFAVGNDGGWWLPYVAHRRTTLPPMLYLAEASVDRVLATNTTIRSLISARSPGELATAMERAGAQYVYAGHQVKQPWEGFLTDDAYFEKLYDREGIRIYRRL